MISWRNLADQMAQAQREAGANLIITDSIYTASALSFYMPRNPAIYVEDGPAIITQFDFWPHYNEAASPNDSALYLTRSNDAQPPAELVEEFRQRRADARSAAARIQAIVEPLELPEIHRRFTSHRRDRDQPHARIRFAAEIAMPTAAALGDFLEFLRFGSISTDSQYKGQVDACAEWLRGEAGRRRAGREAAPDARPSGRARARPAPRRPAHGAHLRPLRCAAG